MAENANGGANTGGFVLRAARSFYYFAACLALLVVAAAIVYAIYLEAVVQVPVHQKPMPKEVPAAAAHVNADLIDGFMSPPQNVQYIPMTNEISTSMSGKEILGYFNATTPVGLARYPDDIEIVGGVDAHYFRKANGGIRGSDGTLHSAVIPTRDLVRDINQMLEAASGEETHLFSLDVIARDARYRVSERTSITISLKLIPQGALPPVPTTLETSGTISDLQRLAIEIATEVDPNKTPVYFDAYSQAVNLPSTCQTQNRNDDFTPIYRDAYQRVKGELSKDNIDLFFLGVCQVWRDYVKQENENQRTAYAKRQSEIEKIQRENNRAESAKYAAMMKRPIVWAVIGGAVMIFMLISLFLAFMAMENHQRSIRKAVDKISSK